MNKRYLSAKEAATALGISKTTVYAYVSRGLIRSEAGEGKTRARRYLVEDIEALLSRKEVRRNPEKAAENALYFGAPVLESAITLIDNGRFYYRGYDVVQLAKERTFAEAASLIWTGDFAGAVLFEQGMSEEAINRCQSLRSQLNGLTFIEAFQAILPFAATSDLAAYDLSETAVMQTGVCILYLLTATVVSDHSSLITHHSSIPALLQRVWLPNSSEAVSLLNAALILCADHELNVSSFTARCVASAGSTPYGAVMAGLAALQGPKHGGYTERVEALFQETGSPERTAATIASRLRRGERIPGFGHPLYPDGDPRGRALLEMVTAVFPDAPAVLLAKGLETAVYDAIHMHPTIDFGLVTLTSALRLPAGSALALFALGRTAGWIGQALEQYQANQMIRPRAKYVGVMGK